MSSGVIQQRSDNAGFRPQLVISAHDKSITTLAYLPDGRRVVTGSGDGTVRVCPLENGKQVAAEKQEHRVGSLAVTRDGTKIVSSNDDGNIKVWDLESQKLVKEWTHPEIWPEIAISPDDQFIASGCWTVAIYTMEGRQVNHSIAVGDVVWSMAFSPDGKKLACTTHDDIRVYDVHSGKIILGPLQGHEDHVRCVLWSRDGSKLFSSSHDCTIRCWNSDTGEQIGHPWTGHTGHIRALSLSPDGSILASASFDQTVRFWDVASELPIGQHLRHDTEVCAVCFSPSGDFLASSGWNGSVYLWPAPSLNPIKDWASTTLPSLPPALLPVIEYDLPSYDPLYLSPPARHFVLPHSSFISESLQTAEGQLQMPTLDIEFPPPPNLTPDISRIQTRYSAGGSFGDVYRCRYHGSSVPKEVAVKAFRFSFSVDGDAGNKSIKMLHRELGIWRRLKHDNIVPFLGIAYGFGMDGTMSLVSLWMPNESVHKFLAMYDENLRVVHRLQFLLDIANGIHYLHSFPIIHGDLNCNNVLLDADYTARLADFGYASLVGNIPEALRWIAPEQIDPDESLNYRTTKGDIYSFGCVALQVFSGKQPWLEVREDAAVVLRLAKGQKPGRPKCRDMDDLHWKLIQDCWSPIDERPTTEVIICTIQRLLSYFPQLPPLRDSLVLSSIHANSLVNASFSSLSQGPTEDLTSNGSINILDKENHKRAYAVPERMGGAYAEHSQKRQRRL